MYGRTLVEHSVLYFSYISVHLYPMHVCIAIWPKDISHIAIWNVMDHVDILILYGTVSSKITHLDSIFRELKSFSIQGDRKSLNW